MKIKSRFNKLPEWLWGGIGCLGIYLLSALVLLLVFIVGGKSLDQNPDILPAG